MKLFQIVLISICAFVLCGTTACKKPSTENGSVPAPAPSNVALPEPPAVAENIEVGKIGGRLAIAALGQGPKSFNPTISNENSSTEINRLLFSRLAWFDWIAQESKPGLAYEWSVAEDKKTWTWKLRKNLRWSDGAPLTADDVVFTWNDVIFNPDIVNVTADAFIIDGKKFEVSKVDDYTVKVVTPTIYAPFVEFFGDVEVLPKHRLMQSVIEKKFESEYGINTPAEKLVTNGPYSVKQFKPGEFILLERNPYYHRFDSSGQRLPYLDNLVFVFTPDMNALTLRFQNGESAFQDRVRPEEYDRYKQDADAGKFQLFDLGTGPEKAFLWFNLNTNATAGFKVTSNPPQIDINWNRKGLGKTPLEQSLPIGEIEISANYGGKRETNSIKLLPGQKLPETVRFSFGAVQIAGSSGAQSVAAKPIVDPVKMSWFRNTKFRQAISYAIDRPSIIKSIYAGRARFNYSYIAPANKRWHNADAKKYPYDLKKARALLKEIGIEDKDGNGTLEDMNGNTIEFILNTNTGNSEREKIAVIVQEDLKRLGIKLIFQPVEFNSLVDKIDVSYNYDCILLGLGGGFLDPTANSNVLKSDGFTHMWFPRQLKPSFPWEARIDELMSAQVKTLDFEERKKYIFEVQEILAREVPFIYTIQPNAYAAVRNGLGNLKPTPMYGFRLTWNIEEIFIKE